MRWALVALCCCARLPDLPSQGGPAWIEMRSAHFVLWTDASQARAAELVQQMEHFRSIIYGVAFPDLPSGGVTFVIALRDRRESALFTPLFHPAFAMFASSTPVEQPTIVMPADAYGGVELVAHELTHAISYNALHVQPRWYAEGIATYFQSIALDTRKSTVDVGIPPADIRDLRSKGPLTLPVMFACKHMGCTDDHIFYSTGWTIYAMLRNKDPQRLAALEQRFATMSSQDAWREVFPDHPAESMRKELLDWLYDGNLQVHSYNIELKIWPTVQRTLSDADVHAVRALLWLTKDPGSVGPEVAAALALDPTNLLARVVERAIRRAPPSVEVAQAVVAAHREQWLAWDLLRSATTRAEDREQAFINMCKLVVANPALAAYDRCRAKLGG